MSQRNFLLLLNTAVLSYACYVRGEQNPYARYISTGLETIDREALEQVPNRELFDGAMRGMVDVLRRHGDEHSEFLTEDEADPLRTEIHQQFGGIGVRIHFEGEPPRLTIVGPPDPGTPAARANLLPGDHILSVDDQPTAGLSMADVLRLMRGAPGTVVRLTVQQAHEERPRTVELTREVIHIESILGEAHGSDGKWQFQLAADPRIAHIRIISFGDRTAEELSGVLDQLTAGGVQAVVLDLRDNAGGALDAAVAVCDLLLPGERTIVETRGPDQALRERYATTGQGRYLGLPLAVVVNQDSASAAEIVAACLQDHGRAAVVGQQTYGKGTVQQIVPLAGKSLLKLTWAKFWRPSGASIDRTVGAPENGKWGVMPDPGYELRLSPEEYAAYRKYRADRDMFGQSALADAADDDEPAANDEFIDKQLGLAAEYVRDRLDEKPAF